MNLRRTVRLALMAALSFSSWQLNAATAPALEEANRNRILLLCEGTEPRTLDPQTAQGVPEHHIIMALTEGLLENDSNDQSKQLPGLADRWEHSEDYSIWKFHLRDNAKWSNGDPVTAQDFIFSYKRILTAILGAPYIDALFILKGAREYAEGKIGNFDQVGVKALDDRNLEFDLIGPTPYFLSAVLHTAWFPVHPSTILKFGRIDERDTKWTRPVKNWNPLALDNHNYKFIDLEEIGTPKLSFAH
jgi:oligopeptide transport system substrate-binding protein